MGAYEELLTTGVAGDETIALLRRLGAQYTRTHSFPPPDDYDRWSDEAVDDMLASMFAAKGTTFLTTCVLSASDDGSLERLFLTSIGNYLKDQAKETERGKLRRRLNGLMTRDERFIHVPASQAGISGWALAGHPTTITTRTFSELEEAARSVRGVSVMRWNTAGPTPAGTRHALLAVAEAVLAAADGVVAEEHLARAVESRFVLLTPLTFTELRADTPVPATDPDDDPAVLASVADLAKDLWQGLDQIERSLLPHLGEPDTELAIIAGVGPKQAKAIADSLAETRKSSSWSRRHAISTNNSSGVRRRHSRRAPTASSAPRTASSAQRRPAFLHQTMRTRWGTCTPARWCAVASAIPAKSANHWRSAVNCAPIPRHTGDSTEHRECSGPATNLTRDISESE